MVPVVQTPEAFFADLLQLIENAKHRVYVQAMLFEARGDMDLLIQALAKAAQRGLEVKLIYDWVSKRHVNSKLEFFPSLNPGIRSYKKRLHKDNQDAISYLRASGVAVLEVNHPVLFEHVFPAINRNHSKLYVIDSSCAWIGGVNLASSHLRYTDCMVKVFSGIMIKHLTAYFHLVWQRRLEEDYVVSCGEDYKFYFDSGKHGDSLIYRTGLQMIGKAERSIVFLSQFVPNGPLLYRLLAKAKQGIPITLVTSSRTNDMFTEFPYVLFYRYFRKQIEQYRTIKFFHHYQKIHAKLLIIDDVEAMIGSHNMAFSGVLFGTQEISLWTRNNIMIEQLGDFTEDTKSKSLADFH